MQHGLVPIFRVTLGRNHQCGLGSGLLVHPGSIAAWELQQELWPLGCVASAGSNWVLQSCKWWGSGTGGGGSRGAGALGRCAGWLA